MAEPSPSSQLQASLLSSIRKALGVRRPILTHLNADSTWLLQLPCPTALNSCSGRLWYNIVIDPWFKGPQSDGASWFSTQWHIIEPSVHTFHELNSCLQKIDQIELIQEFESHKGQPSTRVAQTEESFVDAIVISHEFTDHCNKDSLLNFPRGIPIFASTSAANLIRSWHHFRAIHEIPIASGSPDWDWQNSSTQPLPQWIGLSRVITKFDPLHSATLITFDLKSTVPGVVDGVDEQVEAVLYTPHGIRAEKLHFLNKANPPIRMLVLLHGLHEVTSSPFMQINFGAHNGLKLQRTCNFKYWVSTHDEIKETRGLIAPFLKRKIISSGEALEVEAEQRRTVSEFVPRTGIVNFSDLGNGESMLLE